MLIITDFKLNLKNQQICLTEVEFLMGNFSSALLTKQKDQK